jgi:hypothetical protein
LIGVFVAVKKKKVFEYFGFFEGKIYEKNGANYKGKKQRERHFFFWLMIFLFFSLVEKKFFCKSFSFHIFRKKKVVKDAG